MLKKPIWVPLILLGAVSLSAAPAGRFEPRPQGPRYCRTDPSKSQLLFENGKARFEIVHGKSSPALQAAGELAEVLGKALGVKLPLRKQPSGQLPALIVGDEEAARAAGFDPAKLEWGAFRIKTAGRNIILAGRDELPYSEGTFYAVDDFLERFVGVRFYFPGDVGTVIPSLKKWAVPAIDLADRPDMQTRTMYTYDPFPSNFLGGGSVRWYDGAPRKEAYQLSQRRNRIQQRSPFQSCHGLAHLALLERFGKNHPEYFALNRRNTRELGGPHSARFGHVCFSSEGLKKELFLDAKAILTGKDGSARGAFRDGKPAWPSGNQRYGFFNIMPNDSAYYCQCPKCRPHFADVAWNKPSSQAASDLTWTFMTDIARKLKEEKVPGYVLTMAYAHYAPVPNVEIPDNLLVMLALQGPWAEFTPAGKRQMDLLKQWRKKLGARPYIWNYATKFSARIPLAPNWTPRAFGRYYREAGEDIFGAFLECETDHWIFGFMNYYVFGKMMWNRKADAAAIMAEHFERMYGPGAPEMTRFFDILENLWMHDVVGKVTDSPEGPVSIRPSEYMLWNRIYSPAVRKELNDLLEKAAARCAKEPEALKRIGFMRREFYDRLQEGAKRYAESTAEAAEWKGMMPALREGESLVIDGRGNEAAWKSAPAHFLLPNFMEKSEAVDVRTGFKALRDKDNFYFLIECEEPRTGEMTALRRPHDEFDIWQDNTIEIFLNPSGDRKTGYQLLFNSAGSLSDNTFKLKAMNWKWESGAEYKIAVTPGKMWTIEVRIPRKNMEQCTPGRLIANVVRSRFVAEKRSSFCTWSPKIRTSHDVEGYGTLEFDLPAARSVLPGGDFTEPVYAKRFLGKHKVPQWCGSAIVKDTHIFRTGGMSIRLDDGSQDLHFYDLRGFVKPDTRYRLTFYVKTQDIRSLFAWGGGLYCQIDCGMKPRKTLNYPPNNGKFVGTMPWTRQCFEFTTPREFGRDGRTCLSFNRLRKYNDKKGIAWIDQVELHELPAKKADARP